MKDKFDELLKKIEFHLNEWPEKEKKGEGYCSFCGKKLNKNYWCDDDIDFSYARYCNNEELKQVREHEYYLWIGKSIDFKNQKLINIAREVFDNKKWRYRNSLNKLIMSFKIAYMRLGIPSSLGSVKMSKNFKKIAFFEINGFASPNERVIQYIDNGCSSLKLSEKVKNKAKNIFKKIPFMMGDPKSIASSCVYIANLWFIKEKTQKEIADVFSIQEVTLRNRYKIILEKLGQEFIEKLKIKEVKNRTKFYKK